MTRSAQGDGAVSDQLINLAFRRLDRVNGDPDKLPELESTIVRVFGAQGVIGNGGFRYFFEMNWPKRAPYSSFSQAYRRIGARGAADKLDRAVAMFPFKTPERNQERRNAFMDGLPETHPLFRLGDAVCSDASVWPRLSEYVIKHQAELRIPIAQRRGQRSVSVVRRGGRTPIRPPRVN